MGKPAWNCRETPGVVSSRPGHTRTPGCGRPASGHRDPDDFACGQRPRCRDSRRRASQAGWPAGVQNGALLIRACSASAVPPASSQSDTSPLRCRSGNSTTLIVRAWLARWRATSCACSRPASSLSGRITTALSANQWPKLSDHLPQPPGFVLAQKPAAVRRSASFSPSPCRCRTRTHGAAARTIPPSLSCPHRPSHQHRRSKDAWSHQEAWANIHQHRGAAIR